MSIVGAEFPVRAKLAYLATCSVFNAVVCATLALALLVVCGVISVSASVPSGELLAATISMPLVLTFWFTRRACYVSLLPRLAVQGSMVYLGVLMVGFAALKAKALVSVSSAFILMAISGLCGSILIWWRLNITIGRSAADHTTLSLKAVARQHWVYARWFAGSTVVFWLANSVYLPVIGVVAGLEQAAAFRAMDNLLGPMSQVLTSVGVVLLPVIASDARTRDVCYLRSAARLVSFWAAAVVSGYVALVVILGPRLIRFVYGGDFYVPYLPVLLLLGAALALRAISDTGFGVAAKAARRPDIGFWSACGALAVTVAVGPYLLFRCGALGAALAWFLSSCANSTITLVLFRRTATWANVSPRDAQAS